MMLKVGGGTARRVPSFLTVANTITNQMTATINSKTEAKKALLKEIINAAPEDIKDNVERLFSLTFPEIMKGEMRKSIPKSAANLTHMGETPRQCLILLSKHLTDDSTSDKMFAISEDGEGFIISEKGNAKWELITNEKDEQIIRPTIKKES